ncbi:MAG: L-arabinose isomerase [Pirellulales bacterium]|nr:L-arabinose isomerase [Pirellulales bacterium]
MIQLKELEVWFITGSQHLYGEKTLKQVAANSQAITQALNDRDEISIRVVFKPVLTSPDAILDLCLEANRSPQCIGLIMWMHTFSPAKMWISGLNVLKKPFVHLHTQFNRDIPWSTIDMNYMNLNQSAHGDREFGFICSRMRLARKVIVGFWQDPDVLDRLDTWMRAASAWHDAQGAKIARLGDNMREVAVTEGDKVGAQMQLGYSVNGYSLGNLTTYIRAISEAEVDRLVAEYDTQYNVANPLRSHGPKRASLREAARIELGLRAFLDAGDFKAFTNTFENLEGLAQLPGIAVQRLMADGYGFGAEGDWKTAALVRAMKVMSAGLDGGTSFMEDYTYHLEPSAMKVLGAHMLEICASLASEQPSLEIHPLSIGDKEDPVRLVFNVPPGPGINASILDLGNRFRMLGNQVDVVAPAEPAPHLPVARAVWIPRPDLKRAAAAWILAGGPHHTCFSQAVTAEHLEDFSEMAGLEFLLIDDNTTLPQFKKELRWNEVYYHAAYGF